MKKVTCLFASFGLLLHGASASQQAALDGPSSRSSPVVSDLRKILKLLKKEGRAPKFSSRKQWHLVPSDAWLCNADFSRRIFGDVGRQECFKRVAYEYLLNPAYSGKDWKRIGPDALILGAKTADGAFICFIRNNGNYVPATPGSKSWISSKPESHSRGLGKQK